MRKKQEAMHCLPKRERERGERQREQTWDGVAFVSRGSNKLKALLGNFKMLSTVSGLTKTGVNHTLEDVFLWGGRFNVFDQLMSFIDVLMLEVVDDLRERERERERVKDRRVS
jgi:hypothetical protein